MIATVVNCVTVIIGTLIGLLFAQKVTDELSDIISVAAGVVSLVIGLQMAFEVGNIVFFALALILGGLVGTWLDIDGKILKLGDILSNKFAKNKKGNFAQAFLNASVLFCVGAMAIVGSFKAGTEGDYSILYTKSILDGFMAIAFTAAMGFGTGFSVITIFIYQGALTLLSVFIKDIVSEQMIQELSSCGGALIIMIAINLLNLRKIKTANYLPSLLFIVIFVLAKELFFTNI